MYHFCTYYDANYASRGLAMWESLVTVEPGTPVALFVLCLDDAAYGVVSGENAEGIIPIRLGELEAWDTGLRSVKTARSKVEYYFTLTSCWCRYLMSSRREIRILTYLDADLFFFSSWRSLFQEMGDKSILVIPHRFPNRLAKHEDSGKFNVGWISFRNDDSGNACADWWRARCLEWCYDRHEDGRFADQKYLDSWPALFKGVHVCRHIGANVAPWNVENYQVRKSNKSVMVNHEPLIFYHFQGYHWFNSNMLDPGLAVYGGHCGDNVARLVLVPYAKAVARRSRRLFLGGGVLRSQGNTRWRADGRVGLLYTLRLFLTGYLILSIWGILIYVGSPGVRRCFARWDRLRGRA